MARRTVVRDHNWRQNQVPIFLRLKNYINKNSNDSSKYNIKYYPSNGQITINVFRSSDININYYCSTGTIVVNTKHGSKEVHREQNLGKMFQLLQQFLKSNDAAIVKKTKSTVVHLKNFKERAIAAYGVLIGKHNIITEGENE